MKITAKDYEWKAEADFGLTVKELRSSLEYTIRNLQSALDKIDNGHVEMISRVGIVQGRGHEIDRLCAVMHEQAEMLRVLKALAADDASL